MNVPKPEVLEIRASEPGKREKKTEVARLGVDGSSGRPAEGDERGEGESGTSGAVEDYIAFGIGGPYGLT